MLANTALHSNLKGYCHLLYPIGLSMVFLLSAVMWAPICTTRYGPLTNRDMVTWICHIHIHIQWRLWTYSKVKHTDCSLLCFSWYITSSLACYLLYPFFIVPWVILLPYSYLLILYNYINISHIVNAAGFYFVFFL